MPFSQTVLEQLTFVGKSKQVKQTKTLILNLTLHKNLLRMYYRPKSKCKAMKLWGEPYKINKAKQRILMILN